MRSNTRTATALQKVEGLDFGRLKRKLLEERGWSREHLDDAEALYRRFLALKMVYRGRFICPTDDIDAFWHAHIFDTRAYERDCRTLFGQLVPHYPYFGLRGHGHRAAHDNALGETRALFVEHFGIDPCAHVAMARGALSHARA